MTVNQLIVWPFLRQVLNYNMTQQYEMIHHNHIHLGCLSPRSCRTVKRGCAVIQQLQTSDEKQSSNSKKFKPHPDRSLFVLYKRDHSSTVSTPSLPTITAVLLVVTHGDADTYSQRKLQLLHSAAICTAPLISRMTNAFIRLEVMHHPTRCDARLVIREF